MYSNENLDFDEHLEILERIQEDFWAFFFDGKIKRNTFCQTVMKAIVSKKYKITFIFLLDGSEIQNKRNFDMIKKIGKNYEKLDLEHTIHGFVVPQSVFDELKEALDEFL